MAGDRYTRKALDYPCGGILLPVLPSQVQIAFPLHIPIITKGGGGGMQTRNFRGLKKSSQRANFERVEARAVCVCARARQRCQRV